MSNFKVGSPSVSGASGIAPASPPAAQGSLSVGSAPARRASGVPAPQSDSSQRLKFDSKEQSEAFDMIQAQLPADLAALSAQYLHHKVEVAAQVGLTARAYADVPRNSRENAIKALREWSPSSMLSLRGKSGLAPILDVAVSADGKQSRIEVSASNAHGWGVINDEELALGTPVVLIYDHGTQVPPIFNISCGMFD